MGLIDTDKLCKSLDDKYYPHERFVKLEDILETIKNQSELKAIVIPMNATNGDMIKAVSPHVKYYMYCVEVKLEYHSQYDTGLLFDKKWWNSPYKREIEKQGRMNNGYDKEI